MPGVATTTTLVAFPSSVMFQGELLLTATVTPSSGIVTPTGTVEFRDTDTSTVLGSTTVDGDGNAQLTLFTANEYPVGTHHLQAVFTGTMGVFLNSSSLIIPLYVYQGWNTGRVALSGVFEINFMLPRIGRRTVTLASQWAIIAPDLTVLRTSPFLLSSSITPFITLTGYEGPLWVASPGRTYEVNKTPSFLFFTEQYQ